MLRHIFIGPAMPACTSSELAGVVDTLRGLDKLVPWIKNLSVEATQVWSDVQAVVLTAEFDSQDDWERYMHEPKHLALGERIAPYIDLSRMTVVQTAITASIQA
jgi:hypothetical protein